jgi:hypothetical protein
MTQCSIEALVEVLIGLHLREITGGEAVRHFFGSLRTHWPARDPGQRR